MLKKVLIFHLILAFVRILYVLSEHIDLSTEEAQYWLWSKHLDWSYYSKPPLIAYLNFISTSILGDTVIGVRINAILIGFLVAVFSFLFMKYLFKDEKLAFLTSVFLYGIYSYNFSSIFFLTDSPLLLFWALITFYFYKAVKENNPKDWILTGIFGGLGFLSKYSMVFFFPIALIYLFIKNRKIFKEKWFYYSILIASIFTLPVIIWNFQHDFVTFKHVGHLEGAEVKEISLSQSINYILDYIGGQIAINSIFLFPFFIYVAYRGFKDRKKEEIFYLWFPAITVFLFFLYIAFKKKVEANWPVFAYYSFFLLTYYYIHVKKWFKVALIPFLLSVFSVIVFFYTPILDMIGLGKILPPKKDPTKRVIGWKELGLKVTNIVDHLKTDKYFIFSHSYHIASEMAFYVKGHPQTYCINLGRRMNQFDLWEGIDKFSNKGYYGIYVSDKPISDRVLKGFKKLEKSYIHNVKYRGEIVRIYYIYVLKDYIKIHQLKPQSF